MCPLCKSSNFNLIGNPVVDSELKTLVKKEFKVVKCNDCSFYFLEPELDLTSAEFKILYNESYFTPMSSLYEIIRQRSREKRLDKIQIYCETEIINFLDVGCGEGFTLIEANRRGWKTIGVDIFDNRVEETKKIIDKFVLGDLISAKFSANYFDIIYIDSVMEHITNPFEYLIEMKRILKPGGIAYIGVPNEDCFFHDLKKFKNNLSAKKMISSRLKPFRSPYHIGGFNKKSLRKAIANSGFELIKLRNFAGRLNFLNPKPFSREFWIAIALLPVNLIAFILRREEYLEAYIRKPSS